MVEGIKVGGSGWLTDLVGLGALTSLVPRHVLDEAIDLHGCREERVRKLPAHVVVYLLMALCLFADDDYEEVAQKLTGLLAAMPGSQWEPPTRGAVTQARQRLGAEVVREVFGRVARPAATRVTAGAWLGRWRLMAIDGFTLDLPDTAANLAEFPNDSAGGYARASELTRHLLAGGWPALVAGVAHLRRKPPPCLRGALRSGICDGVSSG
ncbi:transposase domain-containing protein [Microbispora sp. H10885]|uniref:transposase domain-containing protein n=1 Tax=Microbispora sp. H10885 TaxID=2729110 RepID=UPI0016023D00|nr:transposase domain-containing protein [Microbispora sp. H10885]